MIKANVKLRAWGNSIGIVLPKEELKAANLNVNDEVEITVKNKANPLKEAFGFLKGVPAKSKKSTDELLKEIDRELGSRYDDL